MKIMSSTFRREQERLLKEKTHHLNAPEALHATGDQKGIAELNQKIDDVDSDLEGIKSREANIRAGYVYVIAASRRSHLTYSSPIWS